MRAREPGSRNNPALPCVARQSNKKVRAAELSRPDRLFLYAHGAPAPRLRAWRWAWRQPFERDRLARLFAKTVRAVFDPAQRRVDLGDQLALPVAGAQFELAFRFGGSAVG